MVLPSRAKNLRGAAKVIRICSGDGTDVKTEESNPSGLIQVAAAACIKARSYMFPALLPFPASAKLLVKVVACSRQV